MEQTTLKRSEINRRIRHAEEAFRRAGFFLPEWAHWEQEQWQAELGRRGEIVKAGLGWDLTDFGGGDFDSLGLLLFTVRNGPAGGGSSAPYAEKLMLVGDGQVTPRHFHWSKTEDIINRGGGTLVLELHMADRTSEELLEEEFTVYRDGLEMRCTPGEQVRLAPGQSITLYPYLYHSFWGERGQCIVGEVSSVNDDNQDNRFFEPLGRFPSIEEDEPPWRLLCTEYPAG